MNLAIHPAWLRAYILGHLNKRWAKQLSYDHLPRIGYTTPPIPMVAGAPAPNSATPASGLSAKSSNHSQSA